MSHRAGTRCLGVGLAALVVVVAAARESRADRFDVAAGTVVVDHSALYPGFDIRSMFGETIGYSLEPDSVVFADDEPQGSIDFVEWQTPIPVDLYRIRLWAAGDFCTSELRTFDQFRLLAFVGGDFQEIFSLDVEVPYVYDFGCDSSISRGILLSRPVAPVTASLFRAEFRQHGSGPLSGARVSEIDGYTSSRCGDGNEDAAISATDALIALRTAVGTSSCESCICDLTGDDTVSATDALLILKSAVGQPVTTSCPSCFPAGVTASEREGGWGIVARTSRVGRLGLAR